MKALLIVAHGSRRNQSNHEVMALAESLAAKCQHQYSLVMAAFLELAEPSIPTGIRVCAEQGAAEVVILPYFLNTGRHVAEDIPEQIDIGKQDLPNLTITLLPHIGALPEMQNLLIQAAVSK
ncbi:Sirohydrochlorin cobaltochelatase [Methylophaga frappieri]|uniref:Sirohydrochlorin cobaltochelatase n=1 Tax=Methylophaga frappieri (strain ATCC BAA-2434 / DSM 25690 / JAM7) TaxID=754477 RepID=I1YI47_METFJ|nr:CbiX/SirB N-terminal domain-containing protein [Methylophaga frappieri]AFJ02590.1 Sirohydrochlorin cobaltochelatase [Methylophaga frappieri]